MNVAENLRFNLDVDTNSAVQSINQFFNAFDQGAARAQADLRKAFNEEYQTEVNITLKGGKVAAGVIKKIGTDTDRLNTTIKAMNGNFGKTPATIKRSLNALKALRENTRKFSQTTGKVSKDWQLVNQRIKEAERSLRGFYGVRPSGGMGAGGAQSMGNAFTAAGIKARLASEVIIMATRAITASITAMVDRAREIGRLNIALQSFTRDATQADQIMKLAQQTALSYGVSIASVENAWRRVGPSATAAGLTLSETNDVITAAVARMSQMGLSAEQSKRYMEALAQVMGKGKLQGEELRQQFAELDGALRTQVAAFLSAKHGIVNLDDAMQKGEVTAEMFADALVGISQDAVANLITNLGNLNDQFDQLNLEQRFNNLNSILTVASQQWGDIFGPFAESLMRAATLLAGFVATFTTRFPETSKNISDGLKLIGQTAEMVVYGLVFIFDILMQAYERLITSNNTWVKALRAALDPVGALMDAVNGDGGGGGGNNWWEQSVQNARELMGEMGNMQQLFDQTLQQQQQGLENQKAGTAEQQAMTEAVSQTKREYDQLVEAQAQAKEQVKSTKSAYEEQKQKVKELEAAVKARYDKEISSAKTVRDKIKTAMDTEKENYKSMQDAVNARYDAELTRVNQIYDRKLAALDLERDRLGARGPKEQELYMLEKQALEAKIKSGELEGEELLRAEARLERMNRQEQMEKLSAKRKQVEKEKTQAIANIEKQRAAELKKMEDRHKKIIGSYNIQLKEQDKKITKLQEEKKQVGLVADNTKAYNGDLQQGVTELGNQVTKMDTLKGEWDEAIKKVELYNKKLSETPKPKSPSGGGGGGSSNGSGGGPDGARASGGPVAGGSSYQVNELGKEAFLSAAGKLSMINAPAFGTWTAPSSGTVIPAHLTKQLSIPTGGVNLNGAAGANASRAGAGGMSSMVRAISGAMGGGDTFNQNVTVQAANPVQAANNMMVEMTRLKRRRFG